MTVRNFLKFISLLLLSLLSPLCKAEPLEVSDLLPGDLIFFMNPSETSAEHVALFSGIKQDGQPYIIHAVAQPHHAVVSTLIKHQPHTPYHVVRNHNMTLALSAHHRMKVWSQVMVPYDLEAATYAMAIEDSSPFCHPGSGIEDYYRFALEMGKLDFYRRIKYAARRTRPTLPSDDFIKSRGRGFRCAEAAILAFQIEEIAHIVADLSGNYAEKIWVSDKYAHPGLLQKLGATPEYMNYQERLAGPFNVEFGEDLIRIRNHRKTPQHIEYYPSFIAWNKESYGSIEDYQKKMDTSFPIDSKVSTANVMYYHVMHDFGHWKNLGTLHIPPHEFDPFARLAWRVTLSERRASAEEALRKTTEQHRARAATADIESCLNAEAWKTQVENILQHMPPRSPEGRTDRVTHIYGTPVRTPRNRSHSRAEAQASRSSDLPSHPLREEPLEHSDLEMSPTLSSPDPVIRRFFSPHRLIPEGIIDLDQPISSTDN